MPSSTSESCVRIWLCWCDGNRVGVQGAERQVARLRDAQRRFHRLEVAHLADEHHVGVLAQRRAERVGEAARIVMHLALVHQAALVLVHELDRILDREDVLTALAVDLVEHRRQRRGLAAAGRPGDEHETARPVGERGEHCWQVELLEAADLLRNQPVDRRDRPALVEHVAAEARQPLDAEREVELHVLFEALLLRVGEHAVGQLLRVGRRERGSGHRAEVPVDADLGCRIGRDVQVGPVGLDDLPEQLG
jgi:hypothetical protein